MVNGTQTVQQVLDVRLFGEFAMRYGNHVLTGNVGRSKKVWMLIQYLLANRGKEIPQERLMEDLWPEEEYDNPFNTLKNLIYRARTVLKTLFGDEAADFIAFDRNGYSWNAAVPCHVDAEAFDALLREAKAAEDVDKGLELAAEAFELYTGDFLPGMSQCTWAVSKSAYYASLYLQCVKIIAQAYLDREESEEAIRVCELAVGYHPYEEEVHRLLLSAYAQAGRQKTAVEHYQQISKRFYDEFGVALSAETMALYKEIVKSMHNVEMDLIAIKEDLAEMSRLRGAYLCDYAIFKNIYRVNARLMVRSGASIHIGLITVTDARGDVPPVSTIKRVMTALRACVVDHLRCGDTVAQYSSTQLVVMLSHTTRENGCRVLDRLLEVYRQQHPMDTVRVRYRLEAVDPVSD